ncbi:hypothetical protein C5706_32580, partial [Klebsiella pneumoniae]
GLPLAHGDSGLAVERRDRYRRPYEGTDNSAQAMQAYLEWEYGLVDQLARDGTRSAAGAWRQRPRRRAP